MKMPGWDTVFIWELQTIGIQPYMPMICASIKMSYKELKKKKHQILCGFENENKVIVNKINKISKVIQK